MVLVRSISELSAGELFVWAEEPFVVKEVVSVGELYAVPEQGNFYYIVYRNVASGVEAGAFFRPSTLVKMVGYAVAA